MNEEEKKKRENEEDQHIFSKRNQLIGLLFGWEPNLHSYLANISKIQNTFHMLNYKFQYGKRLAQPGGKVKHYI